MSEFVFKLIISFLFLILFLFYYINLKFSKKSNEKRILKINKIYYVNEHHTKIKQCKKLKNGEIISFEFDGEIKCMDGIISGFGDCFIGNFFYRKKYNKYINKKYKCLPEMIEVNL